MATITVQNIQKGYRNKPVLRGVSFTARAGVDETKVLANIDTILAADEAARAYVREKY